MGMFSEGDVRFISNLYARFSGHVDLPGLLHLADSSPMYGRSVAQVATINTQYFAM